jgi:hypothetical protein
VQDGRDAKVSAEMAGIAGEGGERVGGGVEGERVDQPRVALGERVESVGEGEDQDVTRLAGNLARVGLRLLGPQDSRDDSPLAVIERHMCNTPKGPPPATMRWVRLVLQCRLA